RAYAEGIEPPTKGEYLDKPIAGQRVARSSRCAAVADFTRTGRLDIVTNNFNDTPYFFRNQFQHGNYIAFRLKGTKSNRDAVGARVKVYTDGRAMVRQVQAAGGYLSQSSQALHFGLGHREHVERVEIKWPSGVTQLLTNPGVNKLHLIVET